MKTPTKTLKKAILNERRQIIVQTDTDFELGEWSGIQIGKKEALEDELKWLEGFDVYSRDISEVQMSFFYVRERITEIKKRLEDLSK